MPSGIQLFVYFIVLMKIVFVICVVGILYLTFTNQSQQQSKDSSSPYQRFMDAKEVSEFIFMFCMAILVTFRFMPGNADMVVARDSLGAQILTVNMTLEERWLFFAFGILLIIHTNWNTLLSAVQGSSSSNSNGKTTQQQPAADVVDGY